VAQPGGTRSFVKPPLPALSPSPPIAPGGPNCRRVLGTTVGAALPRGEDARARRGFAWQRHSGKGTRGPQPERDLTPLGPSRGGFAAGEGGERRPPSPEPRRVYTAGSCRGAGDGPAAPRGSSRGDFPGVGETLPPRLPPTPTRFVPRSPQPDLNK